MKLSKQERIAAIVVVVLVILAVGVFVFIKPNIETINATKASLAAKKQEFEDDEAKVKTKDTLKTQILSAYDDGKNLADMFFPELKSYEVDNEFRAFLDQCANRSNIHVEGLSVSAPGTAGLSTSVYVPTGTQYALKNYVNQGSTEAVSNGNLLRQRMIQTSLGEPQTIGATTVSFKLHALTIADVLQFADEVNNYEMTQNGKKVRKAIELNGVSFSDARTKYLLEKRGTEAKDKATEAGAQAFQEYLSDASRVSRSALAENAADPAGAAAPAAPATPTAPTTPTTPADPATPANPTDPTTTGEPDVGVDISDNEEKLEFHNFSLDCTITFYSIERMQDPSPILAEQDKSAAPTA